MKGRRKGAPRGQANLLKGHKHQCSKNLIAVPYRDPLPLTFTTFASAPFIRRLHSLQGCRQPRQIGQRHPVLAAARHVSKGATSPKKGTSSEQKTHFFPGLDLVAPIHTSPRTSNPQNPQRSGRCAYKNKVPGSAGALRGSCKVEQGL